MSELTDALKDVKKYLEELNRSKDSSEKQSVIPLPLQNPSK